MSAIRVWSLLVGLGFIAFVSSTSPPVKPEVKPVVDPRLKAVEVKLLVKLLKEKLEIVVAETDPRFNDLNLDTVVRIFNAVRDGESAALFRKDRPLGMKISSFFNITYRKMLRFLNRAKEVANLPPVLICPKNIEVNQEPGVKSAVVNWEEPYATDKEDGVISDRVELATDQPSGSRFPKGNTYIKYRVFDSEGRKDTCWFTITVHVIECRFIWPSKGRITKCYLPLIYGQSCAFECEPGYALEGSSEISCLETGLYDAELPTCKVIECPEPELPVGAELWQCSAGHNYKSMCTLICKDGYTAELRVPTLFMRGSMKCLETSEWTEMPHCTDTTPPVATSCPKVIRVYADRRTNSAEVTWEITAIDNSGEDPVITQTLGPKPGSKIERGGHLVRYSLKDSSGNEEQCIFYVNVLRRVCPPMPDFHPHLKPDCDRQNQHGSNCTFTCSHDIELEGSSFATCEADNDTMYWDYPKGEPTCLEKECVRPPTPPNSHLKCSVVPTGVMCNVECHEGFVTAKNAQVGVNMMCPPATGKWTPPIHSGCVSPAAPKAMEQRILFYWQSECNEEDDRNWITKILESALSKEEFKICTKCVSKQITTQCREVRGSSYVLFWWRNYVPIEPDESADVAESYLDIIALKQKNWLYKNFDTLDLASTDVYSYKAQEKYGDCPLSTVIREGGCAPCGLGYKYDDSTRGCMECPADTYQDGSDTNRCFSCREGTFTDGTRKISANDCKKPCGRGEYSISGLRPCLPCRLNHYQDKQRQTSCVPCKKDEVTLDEGSFSMDDCYVPSEPVIDLQVVSVGKTFIEVEWQHPSETNGEVTVYWLGYKVVPDIAPKKEVVLDADTTRYNLTELQVGTRYEIRVTPEVGEQPGSPATIVAETEQHDLCPPGTVSPTGTYEPIACIACQLGFYNDQSGQIHCTLCDPGKTTLDHGASSKSDCVEEPPKDNPTPCPPGTSSPTGTDQPAACAPCQLGFYTDQPGQIHCKQCDAGKTTVDHGATSNSDCVDSAPPTPEPEPRDPNACDPGTVSITGLKPNCKTCPPNTRPDKAQTLCKPCPLVDSVYDCSA